jgi:hypothetical protein
MAGHTQRRHGRSTTAAAVWITSRDAGKGAGDPDDAGVHNDSGDDDFAEDAGNRWRPRWVLRDSRPG